MWSIIFWVSVGVVIGWNMPQPGWAKSLQERVMAALNGRS